MPIPAQREQRSALLGVGPHSGRKTPSDDRYRRLARRSDHPDANPTMC